MRQYCIDDKPTPHPSVETALFDADAVVFDERTATVHRLNISASAVWVLVDGRRTVKEIVAELADAFSIGAQVLRPEVERALDQFSSLGILDDAPGAFVLRTSADEATAMLADGRRFMTRPTV